MEETVTEERFIKPINKYDVVKVYTGAHTINLVLL
jgi:hypothetical protein